MYKMLCNSPSLPSEARGKAFCRKHLFYPALKIHDFQTLAKLDSVYLASEKYQLSRLAYKAILRLKNICQGMTCLSEKEALLLAVETFCAEHFHGRANMQ
jgi:hypothetical protein